MILLLTTANGDSSVKRIIDWLEYYKADYLNWNGETPYGNRQFNISIDNPKSSNTFIEYFLNGRCSDVNVVYCRRSISGDFFKLPFEDEAFKYQVNNFLGKEHEILRQYLWSYLENAYWVPDFKSIMVNKLLVLENARDVGFRIPKTLITNSKVDVLSLLEEVEELITKPINNMDWFKVKDNIFTLYTTEVNAMDVKYKYSESFFPSLFQEKIKKKYEYRVYYLDGEIYPTIIYSQQSEDTQIDWRNYTDAVIRYEPGILDKKACKKIGQLMNKLSLNTGSLDFIVSESNELFFLEVNPVGQFGDYSDKCNYHLHKKIAEFLIKKDKK